MIAEPLSIANPLLLKGPPRAGGGRRDQPVDRQARPVMIP